MTTRPPALSFTSTEPCDRPPPVFFQWMLSRFVRSADCRQGPIVRVSRLALNLRRISNAQLPSPQAIRRSQSSSKAGRGPWATRKYNQTARAPQAPGSSPNSEGPATRSFVTGYERLRADGTTVTHRLDEPVWFEHGRRRTAGGAAKECGDETEDNETGQRPYPQGVVLLPQPVKRPARSVPSPRRCAPLRTWRHRLPRT
jgi:hypothetical protein